MQPLFLLSFLARNHRKTHENLDAFYIDFLNCMLYNNTKYNMKNGSESIGNSYTVFCDQSGDPRDAYLRLLPADQTQSSAHSAV